MENQISILDLFGRTLVSSGQHQPCQVNEEQFTVYLFSYQVGGIRTGPTALETAPREKSYRQKIIQLFTTSDLTLLYPEQCLQRAASTNLSLSHILNFQDFPRQGFPQSRVALESIFLRKQPKLTFLLIKLLHEVSETRSISIFSLSAWKRLHLGSMSQTI